MSKIESLWDRMEKYAIYGVLFIFFALELMAFFIPAVATFIDNRGALLLIAAVLLFIFRYLDQRLGTQNAAGIVLSPGFMQGLVELLDEKRDYETIEILAYTGLMYLLAFQESSIRVEKLRLLLHRVGGVKGGLFPFDEWGKKKYENEVDRVMEIWLELQQQGRIGTLVVKYYSFYPLYHFMLLDGKKVHFGLFRLKHGFPGTDLLSTYISSDVTPVGRTLINDLKTKFDLVWEEFGFSYAANNGA
jgi:hypothetical protein